jgi:quercetin dioxygenase-like cupin family protein
VADAASSVVAALAASVLMPIEIRRFGVGHRRPDGPPGTTGVTGQAIHNDNRGFVGELAFARGARIDAHANPNTTWLVVIEGGGWVAVGDEQTRVAAGEAVLWPADIPHAAWTDYSQMRAIVVEFMDSDDTVMRGVLEGRARELLPEEAGKDPAARGVGQLAPHDSGLPRHDPEAGEPA